MPRSPSVDEMLSLAFKKIDERVQREKADAVKAEQAAKFKARQEAEEKKRKKQNLIVYCLLTVFLVFLFAVIYRAQQEGLFGRFNFQFLGSMTGRQVDCTIAANWSQPACVESRKAQVDAKWSNMMLNRDGKERPFSVHGDKDDKR